jgi:hypothetical protein
MSIIRFIYFYNYNNFVLIFLFFVFIANSEVKYINKNYK